MHGVSRCPAGESLLSVLPPPPPPPPLSSHVPCHVCLDVQTADVQTADVMADMQMVDNHGVPARSGTPDIDDRDDNQQPPPAPRRPPVYQPGLPPPPYRILPFPNLALQPPQPSMVESVVRSPLPPQDTAESPLHAPSQVRDDVRA